MLSFRSIVALVLLSLVVVTVAYITLLDNVATTSHPNSSTQQDDGEPNQPAYIEINPPANSKIQNPKSQTSPQSQIPPTTSHLPPPQSPNPESHTNTQSPIPNPNSKIQTPNSKLQTSTPDPPPPPKKSGSATGYGISSNLTAPKTNLRLAVDKTNKITVAWEEGSNILNNRVYAKQWDGSNWLFLGREEVGVSSTPSRSPSLAISKDNTPIISYMEISLGGTSTIRVKKWDGTTWGLEYGAGVLAPSDTIPVMALDRSDNPCIAFMDSNNIRTFRWGGGIFNELSPIALEEDADSPMLSINNQNNPIIAYREKDTTIYVKKWDGGKWLDVGAGLTVRTSKEASDIAYALQFPSLCLDSGGNPIIAYHILSYFPWLYVERWSGGKWMELMNYSLSGSEPSVTIARDNNPVMAYRAETVTNSPIYVRKWDGRRSVWQEVDLSATGMGIVVGDVTGTSRNPQVAIGPDGKAVAAWIQHISDTEEYIYIRRQR